jgi:phosphoglycerol transferase MdoB-like AlkP superfamily enzyme
MAQNQKGFRMYQGNVVLVTFFRMVIVLVLLFLSRIVFYLFNLHYFSEIRTSELFNLFIVGLRFDVSGMLIINAPYILMNTVPFTFRYNRYYLGFARFCFYLVNGVGLMANFVDTIYFRFTLKRTTADIFSYLGVGGDFGKLIPQFLHDFWYILVTWLVFIFLLVYLSSRFSVVAPKGKAKGNGLSYIIPHTLILAVVAFAVVIGIRGGTQRRPITIITAGNYTHAKNVSLLLNTPFSIAKTWNHEVLTTKKYFPKESDLDKIFSPVHHYKEKDFKKLNVMIIIMESFSLEHTGFFNASLDNGQYKGYTPFLDSLAGHSLAFAAYANSKTSIQGIPAVLSGIPSLMNESFIQSPYSANNSESLASILDSCGYSSAFFHGGTNGTMGFDSYTKITGFKHYYGRKEYNDEKDYDGKWGIRDEEFFQFTAKKMNELSRPFFVAIFSLSSHHPYYVPEKYKGKFRKGKLPIEESIMYADYSLKKFFETAEKMSWFGNTLFVITADHTSEGYHPFYQTNAGQYAIPILFFKSKSDLKGRPDVIAQQTDIMPSVLDYLGCDKPFVAFGNSLFDDFSAKFSIHYISGSYGLIKDGFLLEFDGEKSTALYDLAKDPLQKHNLVNERKQEKDSLELFIKAYIQQYNNRIIENRLTAG